MATRTVRLDQHTERTLQRLRKETGLTISEVLKRGVDAYAERNAVAQTPYDIYERIALGSGGWAHAPATDAKRQLRELIARKHRR